MTMASSSMIVKLSIVVATILYGVIGGQVTEAAVSCNVVVSNLYPCVSYVTSGGTPTPICCNGVKNLNNLAKTTPDRQGVCRCLESLIKGVAYNAQNVANAGSLPGKCGVKLPYKINPNVNCSTIR